MVALFVAVLLSQRTPKYDAFLSVGQTLFAARHGATWVSASKQTRPPKEAMAWLFFEMFVRPRLEAVADFVGKGQMQFVIAGGEQEGSFAFLWDFAHSKPHRLASFEFSL